MKKLTSPPFWLPFVMAIVLVLGVAALNNKGQGSEAAALNHSSDSPASISGLPQGTLSGVVNGAAGAPVAPLTYTVTVYLPAVLKQFDPAHPPPTETRIVIDGQIDDWAGRPVLFDDPAGDAEEGFLDLTTGYAFVNQHALYLLVETVDPNAPFVQFDVLFQADSRTLLISWAPGQSDGYIGDVTTDYEPVGPTTNSAFAFGPALEGRVDLRDLGSPASLSLIEINVMVGECCEFPAWRAADQWQPAGPTPVVNEVDHPRWVSDEPRYVLARRFKLPLWDWVAERLFAPPAPDLASIGRSQCGDRDHRGVAGDDGARGRSLSSWRLL